MQQVDAVLRARLLRLETVRMLVVDEVDACLQDEGTSALLQRLMGGQLSIPLAQQSLGGGGGGTAKQRQQSQPQRLKPERLAGRQTLFVSATLPQRQHFRRQCAQERWCREAPLLVHSDPAQALPSQLRHGWAPCAPPKRLAALRVLLRRHEPRLRAAIVFARPSMPLARIADALAGVVDDGPPAVLCEDQPLQARAEAVRGLRSGARRLLLSTPLGARGLDIPHCSHVYLLWLPDDSAEYLHAAGRCGRNGRSGLVTTLGSTAEEFALARLGNALDIEFFDARDEEQHEEELEEGEEVE